VDGWLRDYIHVSILASSPDAPIRKRVAMPDQTSVPVVDLQRSHDVDLVRAFLLTYTCDRLGRDAPLRSRVLAHDALDRLAGGA